MGGLPFQHLRGAEAWSGSALDGLAVDGRGAVRLVAGAMSGQLETIALDAGKEGICWHRVYLDAVVPPGCALEVATRSAESPEALEAAEWRPCGPLHRRPPRADRALPSPVGPDDDPVTGLETFEGLVRAAPGRHLALRVELRGTKRRAPALMGIRVSVPRPSMLSFLPAFWREADPDRQMEEWLALFEGGLVELEARVASLPTLLDPATAPAEALAWLAGLLGLALDPRLPEPARRQLIAEAVPLYRRRGTLPGTRRMASLVVGCEVRIVEHFRLRSAGARLGVDVPGPALQLDAEGAEEALAHRYTVVVPLAATPDRSALLDAALAASAPAHAVGRTLWLDAGAALGQGSLLDLSFPLPLEAL